MPAMSSPFISTAPESGVSRPFTSLSAVVLPQPDEPIMVTNSPDSMLRLKSPSTALSP